MNAWLGIGAGVVIAGMSMYVFHLYRRLRKVRIDYEVEKTWCDEFARQVEEAEDEITELRRLYAANLLGEYGGDTVGMLSAAWRVGLCASKEKDSSA